MVYFLVYEIEALFSTSSDAIFRREKTTLRAPRDPTPAKLLTRDVTIPLLGISANQVVIVKEIQGFLVGKADSATIWGKPRNTTTPNNDNPRVTSIYWVDFAS